MHSLGRNEQQNLMLRCWHDLGNSPSSGCLLKPGRQVTRSALGAARWQLGPVRAWCCQRPCQPASFPCAVGPGGGTRSPPRASRPFGNLLTNSADLSGWPLTARVDFPQLPRTSSSCASSSTSRPCMMVATSPPRALLRVLCIQRVHFSAFQVHKDRGARHASRFRGLGLGLGIVGDVASAMLATQAITIAIPVLMAHVHPQTHS